MPKPQMIVLNHGGLRSLIATALMLQEAEEQHQGMRVTLMHVRDGRPSGGARAEHLQRQAEHFGLTRVVELELPHLYGQAQGHAPDGADMGTLATEQMLMAALATARQMQVGRVVWPGSCNGDARAIAQATEQITLLEQMCELSHGQSPTLETPLLELNDQQIVELGVGLGLSGLWNLGWSCTRGQSHPCQACVGCRRRQKAMDAAQINEKPAAPERSRVAAASTRA